MIGWGLLIVSLALAAIHSPWWLAATMILALWQAQRWYFYKGRPWRRVHYPMMRAYAAVAGVESGNAEREHRQFDVKTTLTNLVESVHPEWTRDQRVRFRVRVLFSYTSQVTTPLWLTAHSPITPSTDLREQAKFRARLTSH